MMRKFWIGVIAALAVTDLAGGTYLWWLLGRKSAAAASVSAHAEPRPPKGR